MKKHEYKYKKTAKLLKKLTPYWKLYEKAQEKYDLCISDLNATMEREVGIPGLCIVHSTYGCGIGNAGRSMEYIESFEFNEGKICKL